MAEIPSVPPAPRIIRIESVIWIVLAMAAVGLGLGGTFGYAAGRIAPSFFKNLMAFPGSPNELEPVGTAAFLGATAGVVLGGGLGAFAVLMNVVSAWVAARGRAQGS